MKPFMRQAFITMMQEETPWYLKGGIAKANCIGAYKSIGAASLAASYINLANPGTYDLTEGSAPTFDPATGWTFDGLANYLDTSIHPGVDQSWSAILCIGSATNAGRAFGSFKSPYNFYIAPNLPNVRYANGNVYTVSPSITAKGVMGFAGGSAYRDSMSEPALIATATTAVMPHILIGAMNSNGTPANFFAGVITHLALYNTVLTPAQMNAIMNAINQLDSGLLAFSIAGSDVSPTNVIYAGRGNLVIQTNDKITWTTTYTLAGSSEIRRIFCAASGSIFASGFCTTPGLYKLSGGSGTLVLAMDANCCIWGMDEDSDGNLYVGEYSQSNAGACQIWKSTDDGDNWVQKYSADLGGTSQDHVHDLRVDPTNDWIYASVGDPTDNNIIRSKDAGENWAVIQNTGAQLIAFAFNHGYIYVGTDLTAGGNKIYRFQDAGGASVTLEEAYALPDAYDNPVYCAGEFGTKVFFGTSTEHGSDTAFFVFDGSNWSVLYAGTDLHKYISRHDFNGQFFLQSNRIFTP